MLHISRRARLMLDLSFAAGVFVALLTAVGVGIELSAGRGILMTVAIVAAIGCWTAWRQDASRERAVEMLIVCALVVALAGDGPGVLPLFFVGLIVLMAERGARPGVLAALALVVGSIVVMAVGYRRDATDIAAQTLGALVILGLGLLIAQLVREADQARRESSRLLDELRASLASEKDHVLAQERARAANDLHDGLGHQLTAVQMGLDYADRMRERDPDAAWAEVARARDLSSVALDRMRLWVRALDPVSVGALTGTAALDAVADAFRGTGLEVTVTSRGQERELDRDQALFCLRVVQEGLTNALRHGGAKHVDLVVDQGEGLTLILTDDGTAPETDAVVAAGYGLRSLTERAEQLGGTVEAGWDDGGFCLRARLPSERVAG